MTKFIKAFNNLLPKRIQDNKGVFPWAAAASLVGTGLSAWNSSQKKQENQITQLPEYPESEGARVEWWDRLQEWGQDPNYGAISPDFDLIWDSAQRKVSEYYGGSALKTGARDRLKSSMARRNIQDSPAYDYLNLGLDVEEGNQIKDLATEQSIQKTNLAESGRKNWLASLQNLTAQKPTFIQGQTVTGGSPWMDILGTGLETGGQAYMKYESAEDQNEILKEILDKQNKQKAQESIV